MTTAPLRERLESSDRGAGLAAVFLGTVAFSWGYIIVKALGLPAGLLASGRLVIGAVVLSIVAVALRSQWPRQWGAVVLGGIAFGVHQLLFIAATQRTTIAVVTLLGAIQPLLVAVVSRRTLGERVPPALLACSGLAVAGVVVVVIANLDAPGRSLAGDLLAVVNLFTYTAYFLATKRSRGAGASTLTLTAALFWVALLVVAPLGIVAAPGTSVTWGHVTLLAVLALGSGNGHLLVNWAHPRVSAALASLILAAVPLLSSVWAHLVFGEPYGWRHVLGMLLVVAAIEGGRRVERRNRVAAIAGIPVE